jgi:hypothetical protein
VTQVDGASYGPSVFEIDHPLYTRKIKLRVALLLQIAVPWKQGFIDARRRRRQTRKREAPARANSWDEVTSPYAKRPTQS